MKRRTVTRLLPQMVNDPIKGAICRLEIVKEEYPVIFHEWGTDESGATVAILEFANGHIDLCKPMLMFFNSDTLVEVP